MHTYKCKTLYMYITFHPKQQFTFLSSAHGTFSRIHHILYHITIHHIVYHITNPSKFKIEIISSIYFSNHSSLKLEINYKTKMSKNTNTGSLNTILLYITNGLYKKIKIENL